MKPSNLQTKIFLDSGNPQESRDALALLTFLDGQTTNPSLVAKNPAATGKKFTKTEIYAFYRSIIAEIAEIIPTGSISIEVYADQNTSAREMLDQGKTMFSWIPNAHVKFPTNKQGLLAAEEAVKEGLRVNLTLCFSQNQAAAVYAATRGAKPGQVFVSPFIGRLDDQGDNGLDLIKNITKMYAAGDGHVQLLAASIRTLKHFEDSLALSADIITAPLNMLKAWHEAGLAIPTKTTELPPVPNLKPIPYQELDLEKPWQSFDLDHPLTEKGIDRFVADWNTLLANPL